MREPTRRRRARHGATRSLYLDASCLLRVLFGEDGIRAPLGRHVTAASSKLVEVECFRTLDRARLQGFLDDMETARKNHELARIIDRLHLVPISDEVIASARATFPVSVRALDAIHVATAQWLAGRVGELEFWTHDERQATAALARGLDVHGTVRPAP